MPSSKGKILFLVAEDHFFCSHRLSLAAAARETGYEVLVVTHVDKHEAVIRQAGFDLIALDFKRRSRNPFAALRIIKTIARIYRAERPHIAHHVSLRCVVLGSIAALFARAQNVVNALTGLGFVFSTHSLAMWVLKIMLLEPLLKFLFNRPNSWTILQNIDDKRLLASFGILAEARTVLIRGSGVDIDRFRPTPPPPPPPAEWAHAAGGAGRAHAQTQGGWRFRGGG